MTILVTGGTGTVGSQVVQELLRRGAQVRVLTRSADKAATLPAGAKGVVGDLADPNSLGRAFEAAEGVFLNTAISQTETEEGLNAVRAAKAASARRIVYMTVHQLEARSHIPFIKSKIPVLQAIKDSGIGYTILGPNSFYQNDILVQNAKKHGDSRGRIFCL